MLKKKKEEMEEKKKQGGVQAEELSENLMDQVNGAGNPFDGVPRVPAQPIDDDLRTKS